VRIGLSVACFGVGTALAPLKHPAALVLLAAGLALLLIVVVSNRR